MALQKATFTSASSDVANFTKLDATSSLARGRFSGGDQVVRFFAKTATNAGAATLQAVFKDVGTGKVIASFKATCTPLARREDLDNAGGDYINSVVFDESGTSKLDLLGLITSRQSNSEAIEVWFGITATTSGAVDVAVVASNII